MARGTRAAALPPVRRGPLPAVAAGLAFVVLLAALQPVAAWAPLRNVDLAGERSDARGPDEGSRSRAGGRASLSAATAGYEFPTGASGESIPLPGYEVVMDVEPRDAAGSAGYVGPFLLRGLALTRLGPAGPQANSRQLPARVRDADDGDVDGWSRIGRSVPAAERLELRVSHYDMPIPPHEWSLLFTTDATEAIGLADLRHDPERFAVLDEAPAEWFTYVLRVRDPRRERRVSTDSRAEAASGWHVQLPPVSPELSRVADEARRITSGAGSDLERVERVVAHFRDAYAYSRDASRTCDAAGVVDLLAKREGFCTHFAAASMLMLRTQGIPARLVSGFMVHEWDGAIDAYVVRPRDLHSWIEVRFADAGWVAFDATPPDASRGGGGTVAVSTRWAERVMDDLGAVLGGGGASALRSLAKTLSGMPWGVRVLLAALVLAAALTQVVLLLRRTPGANGRDRDPVVREALRLAERLERALARRGYRRGAAETRRELASRVVRDEGVALGALSSAARDLDAARFGGTPLSADARARIDELIGTLTA